MERSLSFEQLSQLYIELSLTFSDTNYVECGFKQATDKQNKLIKKIRSGNMTKKDIAMIEPIFESGGINISDHIKPKKFLGFFKT